MKKIILLIFCSCFAQSAVVVWPDTTAPCNATLQACINAASLGDILEIVTNTPINESLFIDTALSVIAGNGYSPIFTAGNVLQLADASIGSSRTVSIKGLTFEKGGIYLSSIGRSIIFVVEHNTILSSPANNPGISVNAFSNDVSGTNVRVNFNHVLIDSSESTSLPIAAIRITHDNDGTGAVAGEIYNNTITANGNDAIGIYTIAGSSANFDLNIVGNEIHGGNVAGIRTYRSLSSGTSDFNIVSNVIYTALDGTGSSGIHIENTSGFTNADIINNTVINGRYGVLLSETSGTLTARVYSNLVAFSTVHGFSFGAGVSVNNDYNLYYQNINSIGYTPGANYISANPMIYGLQNARLTPDSPALENGSPLALIFAGNVPLIDADGLLRIKNSDAIGSGNIDIGAYEAGDVSFVHKSSTDISYITTINNANTDGISNLDNLHVTSNWNPDLSAGIYNNDNEAIYYTGSNWAIFNEAKINLQIGTSFNVVQFASTGNTFEHLASVTGSTASSINMTGLNGNPLKILQVSQHWQPSIYNTHPIGILYGFGNWQIFNLDLVNIPQNANFNVYYQDRSKSAYEHIASNANSQGNATYLNNPLINGIPCAQIQVTQSASQGVFNNSPVGVFYDELSQNKWAIFNQNLSVMPENAAYHVLINPAQIALCSNPLLFKDGFE